MARFSCEKNRMIGMGVLISSLLIYFEYIQAVVTL